MSKKKEEVTNPFDYSYKPDSKVEISGHLFSQFLSFLRREITGERKDYFEEQVTEDGQFDMEKTISEPQMKSYFTEKGLYLTQLYYELLSHHADHIEKGVAVPLEELKMSKVD